MTSSLSNSLSLSSSAWAPGVELALWCLMLKASLSLSWSFFKAPATQMLRGACSGTWHHARLQQWEFWRRPAPLKMRSVPSFGTAVLRGKAHAMKMENLDAGPEGMKPRLCVMKMHWAVEVLKNKCSSFEWITRGAWFGREQQEQTVLSTYWHFLRLLFQNPTIYGSKDCSLFLFTNADGIPCPVSPWCEFSASTASSWQVLHVVSL